MRTIKTWLATIAVLLCSITANAQTKVEIDGIWYNLITKGRIAEMTYAPDGSMYTGNVVIPSMVSYGDVNHNVTSIGNNAFKNCSGLTAITIPESVTSIGDNAFEGCCDLTSIVIPNSVTEIGVRAFADCSGLTSLIIPESATQIGQSAFEGCAGELFFNSYIPYYTWYEYSMFYRSNFSKVVIGNKVTHIGDFAFYGCSSISSITIPESVNSISKSAFEGCYGLTEIHINSIKAWCETAFSDTPLRYTHNLYLNGELLTKLVIPEGVTYISGKAFYNCSNLISVTIPESIAEIGYSAFEGCNNLAEVHINNLGAWCEIDVETKASPLYYAHNLYSNDELVTELVIPEGVTNIGTNVFNGCNKITSVVLPKSLKEIAYGAFANCEELVDVYCYAEEAPIANDGTFENSYPIGMTLHIPKSSLEVYKSANVWKGFGVITEAGVSYKTITMKANAGGTIACGSTAVSNGTEYVNTSNNSVEFTITPKAYYTLAKVLVDGTDVTSQVNNGVLTINVTADTEIEAIFDTENEIQLQDEQTSFELESDISCDKITYTRNFTNTTWQPLYVPFEIPVTEDFLKDFEVAYINDARQYDHNDDGKKDETIIEAFKIKTGTLEANYPYLIRAKEIGEKTITVTDATLYKAEENYIDCSSVYDTYTFKGTYERMSSDDLLGCYSLSGGLWTPIASGASLGAFRIYLKIESRKGNAAPAQAIRMRVIGDGETTDIDELESIDNGEQPTIIYDLQGRRVENTENLKGVYVVNGRKVVF